MSRRTRWRPGSDRLGVVLSVAAVLAISCLSGYRAHGLPWRAMWPYTPLGILAQGLSGFKGLPSNCAFAGSFSFSLDYAAVFLKTCLLEAPFYFLAFGRRALFTLAIGNLLTHPLVYFGFPCAFPSYLVAALGAEAFAPLVEIGFGLWIGPRRPCTAVLMLAANLFSWQMGIFV